MGNWGEIYNPTYKGCNTIYLTGRGPHLVGDLVSQSFLPNEVRMPYSPIYLWGVFQNSYFVREGLHSLAPSPRN